MKFLVVLCIFFSVNHAFGTAANYMAANQNSIYQNGQAYSPHYGLSMPTPQYSMPSPYVNYNGYQVPNPGLVFGNNNYTGWNGGGYAMGYAGLYTQNMFHNNLNGMYSLAPPLQTMSMQTLLGLSGGAMLNSGIYPSGNNMMYNLDLSSLYGRRGSSSNFKFDFGSSRPSYRYGYDFNYRTGSGGRSRGGSSRTVYRRFGTDGNERDTDGDDDPPKKKKKKVGSTSGSSSGSGSVSVNVSGNSSRSCVFGEGHPLDIGCSDKCRYLPKEKVWSCSPDIMDVIKSGNLVSYLRVDSDFCSYKLNQKQRKDLDAPKEINRSLCDSLYQGILNAGFWSDCENKTFEVDGNEVSVCTYVKNALIESGRFEVMCARYQAQRKAESDKDIWDNIVEFFSGEDEPLPPSVVTAFEEELKGCEIDAQIESISKNKCAPGELDCLQGVFAKLKLICDYDDEACRKIFLMYADHPDFDAQCNLNKNCFDAFIKFRVSEEALIDFCKNKNKNLCENWNKKVVDENVDSNTSDADKEKLYQVVAGVPANVINSCNNNSICNFGGTIIIFADEKCKNDPKSCLDQAIEQGHITPTKVDIALNTDGNPGQTTAGNTTSGQATAGNTTSGQTSAGEATAGQTTSGTPGDGSITVTDNGQDASADDELLKKVLEALGQMGTAKDVIAGIETSAGGCNVYLEKLAGQQIKVNKGHPLVNGALKTLADFYQDCELLVNPYKSVMTQSDVEMLNENNHVKKYRIKDCSKNFTNGSEEYQTCVDASFAELPDGEKSYFRKAESSNMGKHPHFRSRDKVTPECRETDLSKAYLGFLFGGNASYDDGSINSHQNYSSSKCYDSSATENYSHDKGISLKKDRYTSTKAYAFCSEKADYHGMDCSDFIEVALKSSGLRFNKGNSDKSQNKAESIPNLSTRNIFDSVGKGDSCLASVGVDDDLEAGQIFVAKGKHAFIITGTNNDPLGVNKITNVSDCAKITPDDFNFTIAHSGSYKGMGPSHVKIAKGENASHATYILGYDMYNYLLRKAKIQCFKKLGADVENDPALVDLKTHEGNVKAIKNLGAGENPVSECQNESPMGFKSKCLGSCEQGGE